MASETGHRAVARGQLHSQPTEDSAGPRSPLTPEKFTEAPLTPDQRARVADMLVRVHDANRRQR